MAKKEQPGPIVVALSRREAEVLAVLCVHVGGGPQTTRRYANSIADVLRELGFDGVALNQKKRYATTCNSGIYFENEAK